MSEASHDIEQLDEDINALLDERLEADGSERLSKRLASDAAARRRYIEFVNLHVALEEHFQPEKRRQAVSAVLATIAQPAPGALLPDAAPPTLPGMDASST